jgi:murein L,D-transpeptidase YcbB/YkuD
LHQSTSQDEGCILSDKVTELSQLSLTAQGWEPIRIEKALSGEPQQLTLTRPLSLVLLYRTLRVEKQALWYSADPFNRDAALLQSLNAPFRLAQGKEQR